MKTVRTMISALLCALLCVNSALIPIHAEEGEEIPGEPTQETAEPDPESGDPLLNEIPEAEAGEEDQKQSEEENPQESDGEKPSEEALNNQEITGEEEPGQGNEEDLSAGASLEESAPEESGETPEVPEETEEKEEPQALDDEEDQDAWIRAQEDAVIAEVIREGMSDYAKLEAIAKYIADHFEFGRETTEYYMFKDGRGSAEAGTEMFMNIANRLGIKTIVDAANDMYHKDTYYKDNIAKTSDGKYVLVDANVPESTTKRSYTISYAEPFMYDQVWVGKEYRTRILRSLYFDEEEIRIPETYPEEDPLPVAEIGATYVPEATYYSRVFDQSPSLRRVILPNTELAFSRDALRGHFRVIAEADNPYFKNDGDFLLTKDGKTALHVPDGASETVTVPDGVEHIADGLLNTCKMVKKLVIPEGVKTIGEGVLYNSNCIEDVIIPSTVTSIGAGSLAYCRDARYWVYSRTATLDSHTFEWGSYVIGYTDSTAEAQAKAQNIPFLELGNPFPIEAITFPKTSYAIAVGESLTLTPEFTPYYGTYETLTWKSSDTSVVTVADGVLTGKKAGKATVSVITEHNVKGTVTVSVSQPAEVTSITLSPSPMSVPLGTKGSLTATILPKEASYHTLTWTSDNEAIVTVDQDGVVTGVKLGSANVKAAADNGKSASVTVTVTPYIPIESMQFKEKTRTMHVGDSEDLDLVTEPIYATKNDVLFFITDEDGNPDKSSLTLTPETIQANRKGQYNVSASSATGQNAFQFVYVSDSRYRVAVETDYLEVPAGTTTKLKATITDGSGKPVSREPEFRHFSTDCANVKPDGTLEAKKPGMAEFWVYVKNEDDPYNFAVIQVKVTEAPAPISALSLDVTSLDLAPGESRTLTVTTTPEDADRSQLTWTSDHPEIASVDESGTITANANGNAVITVSAKNGKKTISASCSVRISSPITQLILPASETVHLSEQKTLTPKILPSGASGELEYLSEDPSVLLVSAAGVLTPLKEGTSKVTVRVKNNPSVKAECLVTVTGIAAESITLSPDSFTTAIGRTRRLNAAVMPAETSNPTVTYTSENSSVASVSEDGLVTAVSEGETDIIAAAANGITARCHVVVTRDEIRMELEPKDEFFYTGSAVKPVVTVYDGERKLAEKTDYTVSYRNNTDAGPAAAIVTMKGNYSGKKEQEFAIQPADLSSEEDFTVSVSPLAYSAGKTLKPSVTVTWNEKKLKESDFTVTPATIHEPGDHELRIEGKGNFTGTRTVILSAADPSLTNVSKLKVSAKAVSYYDGISFEDEFLNKIQFSVKNGNDELVRDRDYELKNDQNCGRAGTCTFEVHGLGSYSGQRTVSVKINGTAISGAKMELSRQVSYDGTAKTLEDAGFRLKDKQGNTLVPEEDYRILETSYANNINAGKATVTVLGKGAWSGSRKITFTINANPALITEDRIHIPSVPYAKGGAMPKVTIDGLAEGSDFKVKYTANKAAGEGKAEISLLGNYKSAGKIPAKFTIRKQNIALVYAYSKDIAPGTKKGKYVSAPVLTDLDGKTLKAGTDYDRNLEYYRVDAYGSRTPLDPKADIAEVGMVIDVKVTGINNYEGSRYVRYRVYDKNTVIDLSKATAESLRYDYTGEPIAPAGEDLKVRVNGRPLYEGVDYQIVSVTNNVKKGTGKLMIQGIGAYRGTKTFTFQISERKAG